MDGNRSTLHVNRDPRKTTVDSLAARPGPATGERPRFTAKGHDRTLQDLQHSGMAVTFRFIDDAEYDEVVVVRRDKFTITVRHTEGADAGCEEVIYKHAVRGILLPKVQA
jgi:sRNA-binding regulator protein Hfq